MHRRALLGLAATALAAPALAQSGAWPSRQPIRLVATFPPGGLADTISRLIAPPLAASLGQTVLVENRAGAAGTIGADLVAKAAPDGYTLVVSHSSPHGFAPGLYPNLPYDPVTDFTHLGLVVDTPSALLVTGRSPFRTLGEYLAAARLRPVRFGSSGIGSSGHMMGALLATEGRAAQLDHVPYRGSAPGLQDMLAGNIDSLIDPLTTNMGMLRDGTLRALAVTSAARTAALPDVPSFAELGLPRLTAGNWIGLSGPKALPAPIAARLTADITALIARPELKARFAELASYTADPPVLGADYTAMIAAFTRQWTAVAREQNITAS